MCSRTMPRFGAVWSAGGATALPVSPPDYLDTGVYPTWTNPADGNDAHKIDDLMHAAVNGRGRYLKAQNSLELINDL